MFYNQTFLPFQICSSLDCSWQILEKKNRGHRARLREKENLFRYRRAEFEGNLLRFARDAKIERSRDAQCNTKELP